MKRSMVAAALACALCGLTSACSRPAVAPKPPAFQEKADSLRDWDRVAEAIASEMSRRGLLPDPAAPRAAGRNSDRLAYFVIPREPDSPFLKAVAEALKDQILQRGGTVSAMPGGAVEVALSVDVVRWRPGRRLPDGAGTTLGVTAGLANVLARGGVPTPAGVFGMAAGAGLAFDILRGLAPNTDTEIAWTATITSGDHIVFNMRRPMYVGDAERDLYAAQRARLAQVQYTP